MPVATYYFDGSDAAATDPNGVWTNDANAFDGSTATAATTTTIGSTSSNYLMAEGTNAPTSVDTITQVRARFFGANGGDADTEANIYTDGLGESLGVAIAEAGNGGYGSYVTLTTPTGGWSFTKLQSLEVKIYGTNNAGANPRASRVEIEVTYTVDQGSANTAWLTA